MLLTLSNCVFIIDKMTLMTYFDYLNTAAAATAPVPMTAAAITASPVSMAAASNFDYLDNFFLSSITAAPMATAPMAAMAAPISALFLDLDDLLTS